MQIRSLIEFISLDHEALEREQAVAALNDALELIDLSKLSIEAQFALADAIDKKMLLDMINKLVDVIVTYRLA